jgi:hypothetical protein
MEFWRSKAYMDYFEHLDKKGGFYYEVRYFIYSSRFLWLRWVTDPFFSFFFGVPFSDYSTHSSIRSAGHLPYLNFITCTSRIRPTQPHTRVPGWVLPCQQRWGDAPVHSLAAGLFLPKSKIQFFDEIGYEHSPYTHCPQKEETWTKGRCTCAMERSFG